MLGILKKLFGVKDAPVTEAPYKVETSAEVGKPANDRVEAPAPDNVTAPYKVPEPAATTPIPFVPAGTEASVAAPVKKSPKKQQFEKKPVAEKAPVKAKAPPKPRAPRKPVTK
jgi:hypothetical protein